MNELLSRSILSRTCRTGHGAISASEPARHGAPIQARDVAPDLGIDRGSGVRRCKPTHSKLRGAGFGASGSHSENKALKTSATLEQVVEVVQRMESAK